jgi:hypothetical protein
MIKTLASGAQKRSSAAIHWCILASMTVIWPNGVFRTSESIVRWSARSRAVATASSRLAPAMTVPGFRCRRRRQGSVLERCAQGNGSDWPAFVSPLVTRHATAAAYGINAHQHIDMFEYSCVLPHQF